MIRPDDELAGPRWPSLQASTALPCSTARVSSSAAGATRALSATVLACALALIALPAGAANPEEPPDLYLVESHDWRVILPVSVLASAGEQPTPVLLPEAGSEKWFEHFINRYAPLRPALIEERSGEAPSSSSTIFEDWPPLPSTDESGPSSMRISSRAGSLALVLAERLVPAPEGDEGGPPVWLVDASDYWTGLLSAVAAGAERGVLLPVAAGDESIEKAVRFAASRRSPVRFAEAAGDSGQGGAASLTRASLLLSAGEHELSVDTVTGTEELTRRAAEAFSSRDHDLPPHAVLTNPSDTRGPLASRLSLLSPLFSIARKAPLVLTGREPDDIEAGLEAFETAHGAVTHVTLVGDISALGMREKTDPDDLHEEVDTPRVFTVPALIGVTARSPAEHAVGRLAARNVHDLSLKLGRSLAPRRAFGGVDRPALMLANADEKFVMAELVSIATVEEMENVGWEVTAAYGDRINQDLIFDELPGKEVIVWTGHPTDLTVDLDTGIVDQELDARLVFLQGCYTLHRSDAYVLIQQGAASVIGTYMAIYSASGSAFSKTVLDAMLYYGADQGEALVHARNYLLAYVEMKKLRGHTDWRKTWRGALSFELWGDPTAVTMPPRRAPTLPPVRLEREDELLRFDVPEERFSGLASGRYTLESAPGGQLGAIYTRSDDWGRERRMQPFYFGWVELPDHEEEPRLETAIPDDEWVSLWAPNRRRLYLMVHNRAERTVGREGFVFRIVTDQEEEDDVDGLATIEREEE